MIKSMTSYGRAVKKAEDKDITVELRSVNSRYFDCTVRLPRNYLFLEEKVKSYLQNSVISRGKVEVFIQVESHTADVGLVDVDLEYAKSYVKALEKLRDSLHLRDDISVMRVARNPDIFTSTKKDEDVEGDWLRVKEVLEEAALGFTAMREAEGKRTEEDFREKLALIAGWREEIASLSQKDITGYRDKLEKRIRNLLDENNLPIDENRLLTECAIFADRIAIDEELTRLSSHLTAFTEIAESPEPSGKKLDFLMQEMNRETNTIGSKCQNAEIAAIVVKVKNELEKIREQIQNIE